MNIKKIGILTAIILSFIFFGKLCGVREGTIISALAVGFIARNFKKIFVDSKFKYYSTKIFKLNNSFFVLFKNNGLTLPLFDVYQDLEVC